MLDPKFRRGDTVRVKSRPDWVGSISGDPTKSAGEIWYPVFFGPGRMGRHPESDLEAYELTSDIRQLFIDQRFASRDAFSKLYTHLRLVTSLKSQIYSIGASRTFFFPYQFKPLLKFLDSRNQRILIADEVGLGKTIETGLVFTELRKRHDLKRVLIVPPAHLVTKWRAEMRNRFDLDFSALDKKSLLDFFRKYQQEGDETVVHGIVSLQTLRSRSVMEAWETTCLFTIKKECHGPGQKGAVGSGLSSCIFRWIRKCFNQYSYSRG
jgi:SNF2-related domain